MSEEVKKASYKNLIIGVALVLGLVVGLAIGYVAAPKVAETAELEQKISDLEAQVATLQNQVADKDTQSASTATVKNLKYVGTDKNDLSVTVPDNKIWVVVCIRIYCLRTAGQESLVELTIFDETGELFYCGWGQILTGRVGGILAQSMFAYSGAGTPIVGFQHGYQVSGGTYSYLGCTDYASLPTPCYLEGGAMIRMRDSKGNAQYLKYWLRVLESDA